VDLNLSGRAPQAERVAVVAFPKTGTNLVAKLMAVLGYKVIWQGIRESYQELWDRLRDPSDPESNPKSSFLQPERLFRVLESYPPYVCLMLHKLPIGIHLESWCNSGTPTLILNYRDPRDVILSMVNYLLLKANDHYTELPWNMIHAEVLGAIPDMDGRITYAIKHMPHPIDQFAQHVWMLHHPRVLKLSYEQLVGEQGGGSNSQQDACVRGVMEHLSIRGDRSKVCAKLYDRSARTFHQGKLGAWEAAFSDAHIKAFTYRDIYM